MSPDVSALPRRKGQATALDRRLVAFADARNGLVTTDELLRAGYSEPRIRGLVARGTLHRVHRGVYAVGLPTLGGRATAHAAVLAVGGDAAAAGRTGAALRALTTWFPPTPHVATTRAVRPRSGIAVHQVRGLDGDVELVEGIRCLTLTRLVLDAAHARDRRLLETLWRQGRRQRLLDEGAIVRRTAGRRGRELVGALVAEDEPDTTNAFERTVFALLDGLDLPEPRREVRIGPYVLDFLFDALGLCLEADGFETHGTRTAFAADRDRDRELFAAHGILTLRVAWQQASRDPERVRRQLRACAARMG